MMPAVAGAIGPNSTFSIVGVPIAAGTPILATGGVLGPNRTTTSIQPSSLSNSALADIAQAWGIMSPVKGPPPFCGSIPGSSPGTILTPAGLIPMCGTRPRRPVDAVNKSYVCDYPECCRSFYQKQTMRRHQRDKHREWLEEQDKQKSDERSQFWRYSEMGDSGDDIIGVPHDRNGDVMDSGNGEVWSEGPVGLE